MNATYRTPLLSCTLRGKRLPRALWVFAAGLLLAMHLAGAQAANGGGLILDGIDDFAVAAGSVYPDSADLHDFTVEAWIYPTKSSGYIAVDDAYGIRIVRNDSKTSNT